MKAPNLHLNLLHASERQSSSPVRLRVMLPILSVLACVGCLVWWGVLACQLMLVKSQCASIRRDLEAKKADHGGVLKQMADMRNSQAEFDQLRMYANGRRTYGNMLKQLAEILPEGITLMALEIPEPLPQNLLPPGARPGTHVKPLLGPTGTVETVSFRIRGRTANDGPMNAMMGALGSPAFADSFVADQNGAGKVRSLQQDTSAEGRDVGLLSFDIEYRCVERRFEK